MAKTCKCSFIACLELHAHEAQVIPPHYTLLRACLGTMVRGGHTWFNMNYNIIAETFFAVQSLWSCTTSLPHCGAVNSTPCMESFS